ncbi:lactose-binding lectin l-2-like [Pygocentrus nattereri]|uniref:C-type lectin domain-containing protein n=1 Tax=Pygocentrus nattereri TaxID=42514 RepID=A0AAR2J5D0_PYGNA|nr:lactose-binding lectin l-2-like [Pygocentrus nattereri]
MVRVTEMSLLFVLFMASSASEVTEVDFSAVIEETTQLDLITFVKEQTDTKVTAAQPCLPACPFGWVKFDGRCFNYFSQAVDWATAEGLCLNEGANLVSIHNRNDHQLVKALIRAHDPSENPTWLGLSNCQKRDSWFWSDGTKYDYSKWNKNEPNHSNNECCVHVNWGDQKEWNDIPCNQAYPFVCVKRPA